MPGPLSAVQQLGEPQGWSICQPQPVSLAVPGPQLHQCSGQTSLSRCSKTKGVDPQLQQDHTFGKQHVPFDPQPTQSGPVLQQTSCPAAESVPGLAQTVESPHQIEFPQDGSNASVSGLPKPRVS